MVKTWTEMKRIMRKRYILASYNRDLQLKHQRMTQGNRSVEEYFKETEVMMIRAGKNEENEAIMARFLNGLNHDIRDVVELQEYVDMKELLHKAKQVEQHAFLCFVVSAKGVHVDYEKVTAIQELCLHHVEFAYNMVVDLSLIHI